MPLADSSSAKQDPQWPALASDAVTNKNGFSTPQVAYNRKFWTFQADPGIITEAIAQGNTIPFSMAEHRTGGTALTSRDYKVRLQLDARIANDVQSVSLTH